MLPFIATLLNITLCLSIFVSISNTIANVNAISVDNVYIKKNNDWYFLIEIMRLSAL